ncbi:MAG TPA: TetR family transcriptional regulator [Devosiaceae bacterium]|jgi:AcrR family transcriptional regulator
MGKADITREKIMDAALAEFSAYGIAGARVERIAKTAGCNKNLIYIYFTDKETLFATVLQKHLARVYEANKLTPDDLPGYAGRIFDFAMQHPDLMRLMAWFSLEQRTSIAARQASMTEKVTALIAAQEKGQVGMAFPPGFLVTAIMTLATAWTAANPFGLALDPQATEAPATLRRLVVEAIRRLAAPEA